MGWIEWKDLARAAHGLLILPLLPSLGAALTHTGQPTAMWFIRCSEKREGVKITPLFFHSPFME